MDVPAGIAAEQGLLRQNIALSVIKQSAEQDQAMADILEKSVHNGVPLSETRGANINTSA